MVSIVALASAGTAHGYTISNAFSSGCHEQISSSALRAVRTDLKTAHPLPADDNEQALIDDLQFTPDGDMKDLGAATFLVAIRDNDLKGRGSGDLSQLAEIHGNPDGQREHCLRGADQFEPGGTEAALNDCHAFIHERVAEALDGLKASGDVDPTKRVDLPLHLSLRGSVTASLPTFYVRIGQAIHAVEDSFTHTYRTPDGMRVTVVLNWVDSVNGNLDEAHDGPAHLAELDRCDDPDDRRRVRRELAVEASTAILHAALDPSLSRESKLAQVDATVEKYLGFQPGCNSANQWCAAPEAAYKPSGACGCGVPTKTNEGRGIALSALLLGGLAFARRSRKQKAAVAASLLAVVLFSSGVASAQSTTEAPAAEPVSPSAGQPVAAKPVADDSGKALTPSEKMGIDAPRTRPVAEPGSHDPNKSSFGFYAGFSGSIDKSALAGTLGLRVRTSRHWAFGLDGEWNPWIALNGTPVRQGTVNVYGTGILRFPLAYENFNLRSTLNLGGSYLLTNLYGAPSGSLGIFFGVAPLGIEWKASRAFYLIFNPLNIAVPIPQLKGVPLLYPQYRITIGLEFDTG